MTFERITTDLEMLRVVPCIRGLQGPAATVVGMVAHEVATEGNLADCPYPYAEGSAEVLRYAAEAGRERELALRQVGCGSWSRSACLR